VFVLSEQQKRDTASAQTEEAGKNVQKRNRKYSDDEKGEQRIFDVAEESKEAVMNHNM
jgi:hypothetical protein